VHWCCNLGCQGQQQQQRARRGRGVAGSQGGWAPPSAARQLGCGASPPRAAGKGQGWQEGRHTMVGLVGGPITAASKQAWRGAPLCTWDCNWMPRAAAPRRQQAPLGITCRRRSRHAPGRTAWAGHQPCRLRAAQTPASCAPQQPSLQAARHSPEAGRSQAAACWGSQGLAARRQLPAPQPPAQTAAAARCHRLGQSSGQALQLACPSAGAAAAAGGPCQRAALMPPPGRRWRGVLSWRHWPRQRGGSRKGRRWTTGCWSACARKKEGQAGGVVRRVRASAHTDLRAG
jgi:hypothetical protein